MGIGVGVEVGLGFGLGVGVGAGVSVSVGVGVWVGFLIAPRTLARTESGIGLRRRGWFCEETTSMTAGIIAKRNIKTTPILIFMPSYYHIFNFFTRNL